MILRQIEAARVILALFALLGLAVYLLARKGIATGALPFATAPRRRRADPRRPRLQPVEHRRPGQLPVLVPDRLGDPDRARRQRRLLPAGRAGLRDEPVRRRPAGDRASRRQRAARARAPSRWRALALLYGLPPNGVRLLMLVSAGLVLILVARQGRRLLERAVRETTLRLNLTRYLPRELAPVLSEAEFENLRQGRRITVALLFVDIRDSSALGIQHGAGAARPLRHRLSPPGDRRRVPAWRRRRQVHRRRGADRLRRALAGPRRRRPGARLRPHAPRPRRALEREARLRPAGADRDRRPPGRGLLRGHRRRGATRIHRARRGRERGGADGAGDEDARALASRLPRGGRGGGRERGLGRGRLRAAAGGFAPGGDPDAARRLGRREAVIRTARPRPPPSPRGASAAASAPARTAP